MAAPPASSLLLLSLSQCFTPHLYYCCFNTLHSSPPPHSFCSHFSIYLESSFPGRPFFKTQGILAYSVITFPEKSSLHTSSKNGTPCSVTVLSVCFIFLCDNPYSLTTRSIYIYLYIHIYLFVYCLFSYLNVKSLLFYQVREQCLAHCRCLSNVSGIND